MARGNGIIVSSEPAGRFEECFISGTPKPGTCMELKIGTALKGGRWTMEAAGTTAANSTFSGMSADGDRIPIAVLLCSADHAACPPGQLATDAYVDGARGCVYYPIAGEELNVLLLNLSGTADDYVPGTKLTVDDGTGKLQLSSATPESEPFICLETQTDVAADVLVWAMYTGR